MRHVALGVLLVLVGVAPAQVPDVRARVDLRIANRSEREGDATVRLFDPLGRVSTVGLTFYLEPGFRAFVAQRLQRIPGDPDRDSFLDEYYLEDEGIWRVGKQYLPFGSGDILRESVMAVRADTSLILENLPISVAAVDGGPGSQRGFVARVGGRLGFSAAVGEHFGIASTALGVVRRPEDSPGRRRGWRNAVGFDVFRRTGPFTFRAEGVALRNGHTARDGDLSLVDFQITTDPDRYRSLTFGWTRTAPVRRDVYRLTGSFYVVRNVTFEPLVRYLDSALLDATVTLRLRF